MVAKLEILPGHLSRLRGIRRKFVKSTTVPEPNSWRARTNEEIWRYIVGQVMVVGGSASADRFRASPDLLRKASYRRLCELNPSDARADINSVLREAGTRYASSNISKCRKTAALAHNLRVLQHTKGGPKGFLKRVSQLIGPNADRRRIKYVMKVLWFFRSKSARDFLMEQGLVRDAIALDVRVINVLRQIGIRVPDAVRGNAAAYDRVEADLLRGVCSRLGISGIEFDRVIYQNYDEISKQLKVSA
jgi:hypothetical protein